MGREAAKRLQRKRDLGIGRRIFPVTVGVALWAWLGGYAFAANVLAAQSDTPAAETVQYDSGGFNISALELKPAGAGKHAAVIVVHDSQGLNESIRDMAKQFAQAGFVVLAPDLTSRLGGSRTPAEMAAEVGRLSPNLTVEDVRAAFVYLQKDPDVNPARISTVGIGWGGWRSFMLADSTPELYRAVIYDGSTPTESFETEHAPVLAQYAQFDFRVTGNALWTEKSMTRAGKKFSYFVYPKVYRGFYLPGSQYDAEAAKLAWTRTLEFLQQ